MKEVRSDFLKELVQSLIRKEDSYLFMNDEIKFGFEDEDISRYKNITVFAELFSELRDKGNIQKLNEYRLVNKQDAINEVSNSSYAGVAKSFVETRKQFKETILNVRPLLIIMTIMERMLIQIDCFLDPKVTSRILEQKSGENSTFRYIVLRAPFFHLINGKKEVRAYFGKIEDFINCNSIDDVKHAFPKFDQEAKDIIRAVMYEQMHDTIKLWDQIKSNMPKVDIQFNDFIFDIKSKKS
jgi:predicted transcriptional regulator